MSVIPPDEMESLWDDKFIEKCMEERHDEILKQKYSPSSFQNQYLGDPYVGTSSSATEAKIKYEKFITSDIVKDLLEIAKDMRMDEEMIKLRGTITEGEPEKEEKVEEESDSDIFFDPKDLDI